ncbi:DHBP synthase RibB-like alpha/beta domain-containing protein [Mycena sp. CBHHK59/15]|nr:DHBP synthase RibB-like alpha/beta domain-containing protein [Mycena sp. CBHHK59/15]
MAFSTRILKCDPSSISFPSLASAPTISSPDTRRALEAASRELVEHLQPVAFPTETVYGLGALALNVLATSRIFSAKGRPADNPLIVHVSSFPMLHTLLPKDYVRPRHNPPIITANQPTVAIRMPSHPVARALIAVANAPLAAPSANSSGKPSPTRAEHVRRDLDGKVGIILDGGACGVGVESTVVDGLQPDGDIRVLRPGGVTVEDIERVLREEMAPSGQVPRVLVHRRDYRDEAMEAAPTTPGMKYRHYSPAVPVYLLFTTSPPPDGVESMLAESFLASLKATSDAAQPVKIGILSPSDSTLGTSSLPTEGIEWHRFPLGPTAEPSVTAHLLFDGLLTLERQGVDLILIEEVREEREGLAIMNRVKKAAGEFRWIRFNLT